MPTIAPWLKPADTLEAARGGAAAGSAIASLRQRASEALMQHNDNLARIAASNANSIRDAELGRARLAEAGRQADIEANLTREKIAANERSDAVRAEQNAASLALRREQGQETAWSNPIQTRAGDVLQVNRLTGEKRMIQQGQGPAMSPTAQREFYRTNPALMAEEDAALAEIRSGKPAAEALQAHPMLLKVEPYRSRYIGQMGKAGQLDYQQFLTGETGGEPNLTVTPPQTPAQEAAAPAIRYELKGGKLVKVK